MARNGSGAYVAPAGNPVLTNTIIQSSWANTLVTDLGNEITNSLPRDGQAPMLAPFKIVDGTSAAPGLVFNSDTNSGLYRPTSGTVSVSVSGAEQARFFSGGLLLGQTASTGERLQVTGDVKVTGAVNVSASTSSTHAAQKGYVDGLTAPEKVVVSGTTQAAVAGSHYILTNTGAVTTLTLPTSPAANDTIYITNATTRTDPVVARNTQLLFGVAEDFTFDKADATICIRFADSTYGWRQA